MNQSLTTKHRNKTLTTLLAVFLGGVGAHRFYLYGSRDFWAWNYVMAFILFASAVFLAQSPHTLPISIIALFPVSIFAGWIEAVVTGLTADAKWDARQNANSPRKSASGWPLIVLLVLTFALGVTTFIFCVARATDLFLTGGAFG
ncbi:NINE protein [Herminiimonas fonticola]|uniref:TM2 domain-containing protein n=1 Tax=Herminiimonas fonticola TaxID=303380 RepID=A0A4R6GIV3_9BURK|nr:NINE protein [Herminiimonas fonticola]RBA25099.1 TM2 domain [Herminiimonas fonticola]TDN94214.1 TM2 domain-containing protein [Herminiimonas fonticola]